MKVTFDNHERTLITLMTGMWWWKRQAKVRLVPFEERFNHDTWDTDPVRFRYVVSGEPVPQVLVDQIYVAEWRAGKPERDAELKRRYEVDWKRP